jgi:glycosyltransferase involved in cell wall biosynthesis
VTPRHPINPSLSVIIPAFNEAATLSEIVARVRASGGVEEVIVVDDGSTDATPAIAAELANNEQAPPCRVIRHDRNRGKGAAIRTALAVARGDLVLVQDADL